VVAVERGRVEPAIGLSRRRAALTELSHVLRTGFLVFGHEPPYRTARQLPQKTDRRVLSRSHKDRLMNPL
jgi:hypothetical protein